MTGSKHGIRNLVAGNHTLAVSAFSLIPRSGSNAPSKRECPPFRGGSFAIDYYQRYPENADWDPDSCLLWIGALWNATMATYNPYTSQITQVLEFPNASYTGTMHIGGRSLGLTHRSDHHHYRL